MAYLTVGEKDDGDNVARAFSVNDEHLADIGWRPYERSNGPLGLFIC